MHLGAPPGMCRIVGTIIRLVYGDLRACMNRTAYCIMENRSGVHLEGEVADSHVSVCGRDS